MTNGKTAEEKRTVATKSVKKETRNFDDLIADLNNPVETEKGLYVSIPILGSLRAVEEIPDLEGGRQPNLTHPTNTNRAHSVIQSILGKTTQPSRILHYVKPGHRWRVAQIKIDESNYQAALQMLRFAENIHRMRVDQDDTKNIINGLSTFLVIAIQLTETAISNPKLTTLFSLLTTGAEIVCQFAVLLANVPKNNSLKYLEIIDASIQEIHQRYGLKIQTKTTKYEPTIINVPYQRHATWHMQPTIYPNSRFTLMGAVKESLANVTGKSPKTSTVTRRGTPSVPRSVLQSSNTTLFQSTEPSNASEEQAKIREQLKISRVSIESTYDKVALMKDIGNFLRSAFVIILALVKMLNNNDATKWLTLATGLVSAFITFLTTIIGSEIQHKNKQTYVETIKSIDEIDPVKIISRP